MINTIALLLFTLILASGQLLFKKVGLSLRGRPPMEAITTVLSQPSIYAAGLLYGIATVLWIWILSRVPLSRAYPWVAVGIALVPMLSIKLFHERVGPWFWVGVALILVGILVTQIGYKPN
jgi:multidrug transporter EmrE-like cation transporter